MYELWTLLFLDFLRCNNGQFSTFWMSYIQLVDILLALFRASRDGNWHLHLHAIRQMIPWCFAYDKVNYARYLPAYYAQVISLEKEHPDVYQQFMDGHFTLQLGERKIERLKCENCFATVLAPCHGHWPQQRASLRRPIKKILPRTCRKKSSLQNKCHSIQQL